MADLQALLEEMSARPQDYVSDHSRRTTNTVEGFHGLALVYRDKQTNLSHTHYTCKINMAICHKVMLPTWLIKKCNCSYHSPSLRLTLRRT